MTIHSIVALGIGAALVFAPGRAAPQSTDDQAMRQYQQSIDAYVAMHRDVERWLPPLDPTTDTRSIHDAVARMGTAMQLARPDARRGGIFTPDVSRVLRTRLQVAAEENWAHLGPMFAELRDQMPAIYEPPTVNERFPWYIGSVMPSCLLAVLPALPAELEYRLVGYDLVLIDTHSDLVVDIMPRALGET